METGQDAAHRSGYTKRTFQHLHLAVPMWRQIRIPAFFIAFFLLEISIAQQLPTNPEEEQIKRIDSAVIRAIAWLSESLGNEWRADATAILGYLDRKFAVPGLAELAQNALARSDLTVAERQGFTLPFFRLIDPGSMAQPEEINSIPGLTGRVTAQALHCDRLPLGLGFSPALEQVAKHGGYGLTHALLAIQWIKENRCPADTADLGLLSELWAKQLIRLIDRPDSPTDLRAEGLAMLYYSGHGTILDVGSIERLLASQRPDGGWALTRDHPTGHAHTTSLALWALLEFRYPTAPRYPMVRQFHSK